MEMVYSEHRTDLGRLALQRFKPEGYNRRTANRLKSGRLKASHDQLPQIWNVKSVVWPTTAWNLEG